MTFKNTGANARDTAKEKGQEVRIGSSEPETIPGILKIISKRSNSESTLKKSIRFHEQTR